MGAAKVFKEKKDCTESALHYENSKTLIYGGTQHECTVFYPSVGLLNLSLHNLPMVLLFLPTIQKHASEMNWRH